MTLPLMLRWKVKAALSLAMLCAAKT